MSPSAGFDSEPGARWMRQDLREARELQVLLLPDGAACADGLEIAAGFRPAHEVSGDIYDLLDRGDGRVMLIFGDSCGRGAAAALYGAVVWGLLRTLVAVRPEPAPLLRALNEALLQRRVDGRSVSLMALCWDGRSRRLALANAGATPPILRRRGEFLEIDVGGVPLGMWPAWDYEERSIQLEPHDLMVLCSDGITEQQNELGEPYGHQRLVELLCATWHESSQSIVDAIFSDLNQFASPDGWDDQTLVVFRVS